jgi:enoyl-CoA hydratase/carnithine racemase
LLEELHVALDRATEADVRVIVLTHAGPAFCSGIDLKERAAGGFDGGPMARAFERLMHCDQVSIAAVHGTVRAGGVGLMASCDLVVVSPDTTFAFTEVRIGVAPAMIAVPIMRRVHAGQLATPFLTGEAFNAASAQSMCLVTHVSADVAAKVSELTAAVLKGAPGALAVTKQLLRDLPGRPVSESLVAMRSLSDQLFDSSEGREGMSAFLAKRPPSWT